MPTLLAIANAETLMPNDYDEVRKYVMGKVKNLSNVTVLASNTPKNIDKLIPDIMVWLDKTIGEVKASYPSRKALTNLFYIDAIVQLFATCQDRAENLVKRTDMVNNNMRKKSAKISDLQTKWMIIQNEMIQHKNETLNKINSLMTKNRNEVIRQLTHNVEMVATQRCTGRKSSPID